MKGQKGNALRASYRRRLYSVRVHTGAGNRCYPLVRKGQKGNATSGRILDDIMKKLNADQVIAIAIIILIFGMFVYATFATWNG